MSSEKEHEDEHEELYRMHIDECIKDFGSILLRIAPKGSQGAVESRSQMTEFCGVTDGTIMDWMHRGKHGPAGESLFKLQCFLGLVGYQVIEVSALSEPIRNFLKLIGFGVITVNEASRRLGYNKNSSLHAVFAGKNKPNAEKQREMWEIWKGLKSELLAAEHEAAKNLNPLYKLGAVLPRDQPATVVRTHTPGVVTDSETEEGVNAEDLASLRINREAVAKLIEGLSLFLEEDIFLSLDAKEQKHWVDRLCPIALKLSSQLTSISSELMTRR